MTLQIARLDKWFWSMFEPISVWSIFTLDQLYVNWEQIMSRYDFPVLSLNTSFKIINTTKSGFRIIKSTTILKNNSKNVIQRESPLVNLTMAGWTDIHTIIRSRVFEESTPKHVLKPALKKLYQYCRGWTICVETHELCILPDPEESKLLLWESR